MDTRGWSEIRYKLCRPRRAQLRGPRLAVIGARAEGHDTAYIGVSFIGRDPDVTDAAERAAAASYEKHCRSGGRAESSPRASRPRHPGLPRAGVGVGDLYPHSSQR